MIRISGGRFRGRFIHCPSGGNVRPATNQVRQAVFNHLSARVEKAPVLDVFAGCGSIGIEAISRGASFCVFIEKNFAMCEAIRRNSKELHIESESVVQKCDAFKVDQYVQSGDSYSLIFMDPPFPFFERQLQDVMNLFTKLQIALKPDGRIVLRTPARLKLFSNGAPTLAKILDSGDSHINVFHRIERNEI